MFVLKIRRCKFFDKSHVWSEKECTVVCVKQNKKIECKEKVKGMEKKHCTQGKSAHNGLCFLTLGEARHF